MPIKEYHVLFVYVIQNQIKNLSKNQRKYYEFVILIVSIVLVLLRRSILLSYNIFIIR